jgi:isopenicillin-N N-acyltransferase-like protein
LIGRFSGSPPAQLPRGPNIEIKWSNYEGCKRGTGVKKRKRFEIIECGGTAFDIGKQYGTACRNSCITSINSMFEEYTVSNKTSKEEIITTLRKYIPLVESLDPHLLEMLKGQAEGVGVALEEIFLLRCNFELSFYYQRMKTFCTSFAVTNKATKDGKTIIGQNFDATCGRTMDLVKVTHTDGLKQLSLIFWGACELTLNSAGLGMVLNVVVSPVEEQLLNLPACCVIPKAMRQKRIGDALGIFCTAGRSMMYYCLASKEGDIIGIETNPVDYNVIQPDKDVLAHANHYNTDRLKKGELVYMGAPSSYIRESQIRRLIEKQYGNITLERMMEIMSNHNHYPKGICNHALEGSTAETLASVIMVPEDNAMYVTFGHPCEYEYEEYKLT